MIEILSAAKELDAGKRGQDRTILEDNDDRNCTRSERARRGEKRPRPYFLEDTDDKNLTGANELDAGERDHDRTF